MGGMFTYAFTSGLYCLFGNSVKTSHVGMLGRRASRLVSVTQGLQHAIVVCTSCDGKLCDKRVVCMCTVEYVKLGIVPAHGS